MSQFFASGGQSIGVSASTALIRYNYFTFHEVHTLICTSQCFLVYSYSCILITTAKFQDTSITSERNPNTHSRSYPPPKPLASTDFFLSLDFPTQDTACKWGLTTEACCVWPVCLSALLSWRAPGTQCSVVWTHHTCLSPCQLMNIGFSMLLAYSCSLTLSTFQSLLDLQP